MRRRPAGRTAFARPLRVTTVRTTPGDGFVERELLFDDPWGGTFHGLYRVPEPPGREGLRVYRALVALRWLRHRPELAAGRLGLIGHSGGSSTADLVVRLEPRLAAAVSDHFVDW